MAGRGQALHSSIAYGAGGALGVGISGLLWDRVGPSSPFLFGAMMSTVAWVGASMLARDARVQSWSVA